FFKLLLETLGPANWLYVAVMEKGQALIAYELGFRCGKELWCYTKSYDRLYAYYSPGHMLLPAIIEYGFHNGYTKYDLLRGKEEFKNWLSKDLQQPVRFEIWKTNYRSRLAALVYFTIRHHVYKTIMLIRGLDIHADL